MHSLPELCNVNPERSLEEKEQEAIRPILNINEYIIHHLQKA